MQKKRHTITEIIKILRDVEGGQSIAQICQVYNISEQTYYRWKQKYGGMEVSEAHRAKELEEENQRLKKKVADLVLEVDLLKEVVSKKW